MLRPLYFISLILYASGALAIDSLVSSRDQCSLEDGVSLFVLYPLMASLFLRDSGWVKDHGLGYVLDCSVWFVTQALLACTDVCQCGEWTAAPQPSFPHTHWPAISLRRECVWSSSTRIWSKPVRSHSYSARSLTPGTLPALYTHVCTHT